MTSKIALDTNVIVYIHDSNETVKSKTAKQLVTSSSAFISTQALSEYLNVLKWLLNIGKAELLKKAAEWLQECIVAAVSLETLHNAAALTNKYDFQIFDAVIVASALENGCTTLYSEDMQHKQVIENTLTVINPFV